jgi:hypothetical protein
VNVLRQTHRALRPGADLLDFHPVVPPWARVEAGGNAVGDIVEADFPEQLRAAEDGMDEAVRLGLFRLVDQRAHELREHYDDADDLIDTWEDTIDPELEQRIRASHGPLAVVDRVVFRLYRSV